MNRYSDNALLCSQDAETAAIMENVLIEGNNFAESNMDLAATGEANLSSGSHDSYHIWLESAIGVTVKGNTMSDSIGQTAGGIAANVVYDEITGNDMSGLTASAISLYTSFADGSGGVIKDNKGAQTTDSGKGAILAGTSSIEVTPDTVYYTDKPSKFYQITQTSALSGSAAYSTGADANGSRFGVQARDSSHALSNVASDMTFNWDFKLKNPKGVFGKTVR